MSPSGGDLFHMNTFRIKFLIIILLFVCTEISSPIQALHVQGRWNSSEQFLKVVARFAVQKTDAQNIDETRGYVYGNVSSPTSDSSLTKVMLFVNGSLFKQIFTIHNEQFVRNQSEIITEHDKKTLFCKSIQSLVNTQYANNSSKYLYSDYNDARLNNIHYVPCQQNCSCHHKDDDDDDGHSSSWPYQYTYFVDTFHDSSFWYLLFLSCEPKTNSNSHRQEWKFSDAESEIDYDIWLVNGHPSKLSSFIIDFDHQFSFEQQNLMFYFAWLFCFLTLLILQLCALTFKNVYHRYLNYLFVACLTLHCIAYMFYCIHKTVFAFDGEGFEELHISADVIKLLSTSLFMLFVLIIAKGWPMNRRNLYSKSMLFVIWCIYTVIRFLLFIWIKRTVDFIEEIDEHHTLPGWIGMGFRIFFMLWFIRELRHTMILEQDSQKLRFYLHFGAGMIVWFVQLPLVASIAMQIEAMSRYKIISGFSSAADVFAYGVVTRLMWQSSNKRFLARDAANQPDDSRFYDSFRRENIDINRAKVEFDNGISCDTSRLA